MRSRSLVGAVVIAAVLALGLVQSAWGQSVVAAVLPSSRSVTVGRPATAFATIINIGSSTALGCRIRPITNVPAAFQFQTTNAANVPVGTVNGPVDIPAGASQSFVFAFTPTAPLPAIDVMLGYGCTNTLDAPVVIGLNTLLLTASSSPAPDIIALAATADNNGTVSILSVPGAAAFAVATINAGAGGLITVVPDVGGARQVSATICQTNPVTGACLATAAGSVTLAIAAGAMPTFAVFVNSASTLPFDPASNRVFVRFLDAGGTVRGSTSVAVQTSTLVQFAVSPLPPATVGVPYAFSFCTPAVGPMDLCGGPGHPATNPTGGQPPYHFVLDSGVGFPPFGISLNLNGLLTGTPTVAGNRTFRVCAVDLAGLRACQTVVLAVNPAGGSLGGSFTGSVIDTVSLPPCSFRDTVRFNVSATVTGSGTLIDPFNGTFNATNGTLVISVITNPGGNCFGDTIPFSISGPVSGSSGKIEVHIQTTVRGSLVTVDVTNGVISGETFTGNIRIDLGFGPPPIQGTLTLTRQ